MRLSGDMSKTYPSVGQAGTSRYMSPELLDRYSDIGKPDAYKQVDIYALALVIWEILNKTTLPELSFTPGKSIFQVAESLTVSSRVFGTLRAFGLGPAKQRYYAISGGLKRTKTEHQTVLDA